MPFKEFWIVSGSGLCLAVSPASVMGDKLLSADTFVFWTKRPDRGRWIKVEDKEDYIGKGYGTSWVKLTVQKKDGNQEKYKLTRIDKDLDFSLPFTPDKSALDGISKDNLKISLFKKPIWSESTFEDDEYDAPLDNTKIGQLFDNQTESKVKTLLLSLSTRRFWKKIENDNFFSLLHRPRSIEDLKYTLRIKYFTDFDNLKTYVHSQVTKCTDENKCEATKTGLKILDQDTSEFYKDPE